VPVTALARRFFDASDRRLELRDVVIHALAQAVEPVVRVMRLARGSARHVGLG
jgi:hypothetical protein